MTWPICNQDLKFRISPAEVSVAKVLSQYFEVTKSCVRISKGGKSREKIDFPFAQSVLDNRFRVDGIRDNIGSFEHAKPYKNMPVFLVFDTHDMYQVAFASDLVSTVD